MAAATPVAIPAVIPVSCTSLVIAEIVHLPFVVSNVLVSSVHVQYPFAVESKFAAEGQSGDGP